MEKKKGTAVKNMSSKKKKESQKAKPERLKTHEQQPVDLDSDSTSNSDDNDVDFAKNMQKVQAGISGRDGGRITPGPKLGTASYVPRNTNNNNLPSSSHMTMGLDEFSTGKSKASQPVNMQTVSVKWPLEGRYDFRLVCRLCFVKEGEGAKGYLYREKYSHQCGHDVLVVRSTENPQLNWLKVRPRTIFENSPHFYKYKMCQHFQQNMPCRLSEARCTFAHNHVEVSLWNMDRDQQFDIAGFIRDAKRKEIFSSAHLNAKSRTSQYHGASEQYIPGLPPSLSKTVNCPPSVELGLPPSVKQFTPRQFFVQERPPVFASRPQMFSQPPPKPSPQFPQMHNQPPPPFNSFKETPPSTIGSIANPFPQFEFKMCCRMCLQVTGVAWHYKYVSLNHQCTHSWLAYHIRENNQNVWVRVRERKSHRHFPGNYILCYSVVNQNKEHCHFGEDNCSFAHNVIEQRLWGMEKNGKFDVGEFIQQQQQQQIPQSAPVYETNLSQANFYIGILLDRYPGYFQFICRACYFSKPARIRIQGVGDCCSDAAKHCWSVCRILSHVKNTAYTPIDERKFRHPGAYFTMCKDLVYCRWWLENRCKFAHSHVERLVWMMERDTNISREEIVARSIEVFTGSVTKQAGAGTRSPETGVRTTSPAPAASMAQPAQAEGMQPVPAIRITEFCRTCWGKGQKTQEDGKKDKCVRGHNNFKLNSVFLAVPSGKEIRSFPSNLPPGLKLTLCDFLNKCSRKVCYHPHSQEELEVWSWMQRRNVKSLRELCDISKEFEKSKTRKIKTGESVVTVDTGQSSSWQAKTLNQIVAPGDWVINEHYCQYCGISCNSQRQWDDHCLSEKHINNVNSDAEHPWNYRHPPWGQGSNLALCAKHFHNRSCQYSYAPDMYNLCKYAHSQEELDEWRERHDWRILKRNMAKERHMFSYTENLLEEFYNQDNSVHVISESLPYVQVACEEDPTVYKEDKNSTFTWTYEIHSQRSLEKVALLHNKDRLHFTLLCGDGSHHQVSSGDHFIDVDNAGKACYKIVVQFTGTMLGSFSQWVIFDFAAKPVLVRKLNVEIGDWKQHQKVQELREDVALDRWTSQNKEIVRPDSGPMDASMEESNKFTEQLLNRYKEPVASEDVVTMDSFVELNQNNYVHKMHKLLELEEITRHRIISMYNLLTEVMITKTIDEPGVFLGAPNEDLFIRVNLAENLTEDTMAGKLLLSSVRSVLLAPRNSTSSKVYEAEIVSDSNYNYDGRGKEYMYLALCSRSVKALGLTHGQVMQMELQFQMDRRSFCRLHYSLDCLKTMDVLFPDVVKFKANLSQVSAQRIKSSVLNEDQMTAVRHIVMERAGYTPPFIMYGPFGTGKTETLAQATMALLKERQNVHILVCTQSNSAADLYIKKHLDVFFKKTGAKCKMLRLLDPKRRRSTIDKSVLPYCYSPNGFTFAIPSKEHIQQFSVVLCTVETSVELSRLGLGDFFSHIFVDEAGQALEVETVIPLTLATTKTCVVLTGDHKQLGPVVYSQEAKKQNFSVSLLVRLYNHYDYIANCGFTQVTEHSRQSPLNIFLSINYRTKSEILRFISTVFYGGPDHLKAYGKIPSVVRITPLMFYAVQGKEVQNNDSTSYANPMEAQEVVARVKELLEDWPEEWGQREPQKVAIVTNYSEQVKIIRQLLRRDRSKPYNLSQVDVGTIHNVQGQEFRALFISAVRTTNLLYEAHIMNSLKQNGDIGDLGFLSNSKLLNTALTRAQSFVGVVGDPFALCLIGECIQEWKTYLKHCNDMRSIRPSTVTYDLIGKTVVQIQSGPARGILSLMSSRSQQNQKGYLPPQQTVARHASDKEAAQSQSRIRTEEEPALPCSSIKQQEEYQWETITSQSHPHLEMKSSLAPDKRSHQKCDYQFSDDVLSLGSEISCEDIIFELARENQDSSGSGENTMKSGGILMEERSGFAVLTYSLLGNNQPFHITLDNEDFIAFSLCDDNQQFTHYEHFSTETLQLKLNNEPNVYKRCVLRVQGQQATATILDPLATGGMMGEEGKDIAIWGQLNRGHAFDGDEVVVRLTDLQDNDNPQGQVMGILKRAQDPSNKLFVCSADSEHKGILTPINSYIPRLYCLTNECHLKLARKGNICVYRFTSSNCIEFSHYERIDPSNPRRKLFIVRYLCWQQGFTLPVGVVVGTLPLGDTLDKGMKILEVDNNIRRSLRPLACKEAERIFPSNFSVPAELMKNRRDLTENYCFSINSALTQDIQMLMHVTQIDDKYEIGIHVSDVVAFVEKDSALDQECEYRGASLFPLGTEPRHMLPVQASTDFCSLKPGFDRLALSVLIHVDVDAKQIGPPEVFRSVVNSKQGFSHAEIEDILLNPEEAHEDYLKSCVIVLYQSSMTWRQHRLGNAHMNLDIDPSKRMFQHSHLMLDEVKIYFNETVAGILLSVLEDHTPLLVQPSPPKQKLDHWKKANAPHAFNSILMTKAFLTNDVCRCEQTCTCIFGYLRQQGLQQGETVSMLKDSWLGVCQATDNEYGDFEMAKDLISDTKSLPQVAVAASKLKAIERPAQLVCSNSVSSEENGHYTLCVKCYTNFVNPLRRFISLVVQRLLIACMEGSPSPYTSREVEDLCAQATLTEQEVSRYHQAVSSLHLSSALNAHPLVLDALVTSVDEEKATLDFPDMQSLGVSEQTLLLSEICPVKIKPVEHLAGSMQLYWEERVYEHAAVSTQTQFDAVDLNSDRFVCNIPTFHWQQLLIAARMNDTTAFAACVQGISKLIGGDMELLSGNTTEVLSDIGKDGRMRHFVPFSFTLHQNQVVRAQVSVSLEKGVLSPCLQLVNLTPCLDICLEHKSNPVKCFAIPDLPTQAAMTFPDVRSYQMAWLPILGLESAEQAVRAGDRLIIHSMKITWSSQTSPTGALPQGSFFLSQEFCSRANFQPDLSAGLRATLVGEDQLFCEDSSFCMDYLCVRYTDVTVPEEPGLDESVSALINNEQPVAWVAHCRVVDVVKIQGGFHVRIVLAHASMKIPQDFLNPEVAQHMCMIEWISNTKEQRLIDLSVRSLHNAAAFAKDIATGRKPENTIDPVPMDNSVRRSQMSVAQEEAIAHSYKHPLSVITGGPGTGKSLLAAALAHLLVQRNKVADEFRQREHANTQLMICGPSENSLDVLTGYLQGLNMKNVNILRVYSEDIEERDYPMFLSPKPSQGGRLVPTCAVMEDIALHHLIRRQTNAENKALLQQEMWMTMYREQLGTEHISALKNSMERAQMLEVKKAQVILCTCSTSGRAILRQAANVKQIIMDDAQLISEPQCIVPLVVHKCVNQLVLLGDPRMPQPHVLNKVAAQQGMSRSLLQRRADLAQRLTAQYRSGLGLFGFLSELFYEGELTASSVGVAPAPTIPWPTEAGFPSVFCHVQGTELLQQNGNRSREEMLVNLQEAQCINALASALVHKHRVKETSILILTTTTAQATALREMVFRDISVSTVQESIGRESDYVILSTVRSIPVSEVLQPPTSAWMKTHLGAVADPNFVNLSLTRAKAALFIVGNKHLLGVCEPWTSLLQSYHRKNGLQTNIQTFLHSLSS